MFVEELHDLLAYNGIKIFQRKDLFRFSIDSLLLADFVRINPRTKQLMDLGTGLGPIPLYLSLKTDKPILGIELQKEAVLLAKRSIEYNQLDHQISILQQDIKTAYKRFAPNSFDIVVCNPPFFKNHEHSLKNDLDALTLARHEVNIDFFEIVLAAKRLVSTGGAFYVIHRASRLEELIQVYQQHGFVIKRMRFVYSKPNQDALMVLIDARLNGNTGDLKVLEPLYIYDQNNEYTQEILKIFHLGDTNYEKEQELSIK